MNEDSGLSAVYSRVLDTAGYGLSRLIDAEFPTPYYVNDPATGQWAIGPQGQLYGRGQPAYVPGAAAAISPSMLLLLVGAAGLVALVALKG